MNSFRRLARPLKTATLIGSVLAVSLSAGAQVFSQPVNVTVGGYNEVYWSDYQPNRITNNVPSSIASGGTATNEIVLDVRGVRTLDAYLGGQLTATNPAAATLILPYVVSPDRTNWTSSAVGSISLTFTGTVPILSRTNINVQDAGFIKFTAWGSTATNIATNLTLTVVAKPQNVRSRSK